MHLETGEEILREERIHPGVFIPPAMYLLTVLLFVVLPFLAMMRMFNGLLGVSHGGGMTVVLLWPFLLISIGVFVFPLLAFLKSTITLTNTRVRFHTGGLFRASGEVPLENIETISLVEPVLGRVFGYGTITFTTVGGATFPLAFIRDPESFRTALQAAVKGAKTGLNKPPSPPRQPPSRSAGNPFTSAVVHEFPPSASQANDAGNDDSRYMPKPPQ